MIKSKTKNEDQFRVILKQIDKELILKQIKLLMKEEWL